MAEATQTETNPELEAQAREMGWRPKEEFKGAEDKWVDAATFVERGEHVLPIIKETNKRLRTELATANTKLNTLEQAVKDSQETIKALDKYHQDDVKQKVEAARVKLRAELVAAKKAGDVEGEVRLTEELVELNAAETARVEETTVTSRAAPAKDYTKEQEFIEWKEDNPWFGKDKARTAIAHQATIDLRAAGEKSVGRAFLDKVAEETTKEITRLTGRPAQSKVESGKGGAGGSNGGGSGGKSYADLPADAKAACDSYTRDLVGPNRKYATADEWRKSYVAQYFAEV